MTGGAARNRRAGDGRFVEVQGTAERGVFDRAALDGLVDLAAGGIVELTKAQQTALDE